MHNIPDILKERQATHGNFAEFANIEQALQSIVLSNQAFYTNVQKSAIRMICHKLARITCGDPNHTDHWVDIAGYATLVVTELTKKPQ